MEENEDARSQEESNRCLAKARRDYVHRFEFVCLLTFAFCRALRAAQLQA
jgi:hypothetical protein